MREGKRVAKKGGDKKPARGAVVDDDRFKHVHKDPRFQRMPKDQRKFKVDKRFQGMFNEKKFKMDCKCAGGSRLCDHIAITFKFCLQYTRYNAPRLFPIKHSHPYISSRCR